MGGILPVDGAIRWMSTASAKLGAMDSAASGFQDVDLSGAMGKLGNALGDLPKGQGGKVNVLSTDDLSPPKRGRLG